MTPKVENLAAKIAALGENEQEALWGRVSELNFRRGLSTLSKLYQKRLQQWGQLDRSIEEILADLERMREEIAAHDYPE